MYGFHVGWKFYLKIYMLNPACMQRLADLLRNGTIMGRPFQPYEVHIPYLLQFMADFGLYGCGWVECQIVAFRAPVPLGQDSLHGQSNLWDDFTIPEHLITSSKDKPRLSRCALEIDLLSHHILNRQTIKPRMLHYDFVEHSNPLPLQEKLVHSMAELWRDEERRRAQRGENQPVPSMYDAGSTCHKDDGEKGPWIHEEEMRAKLDDLIRRERNRSDGHALQFENFVKQTKFQSLVQTALESVTDMFPSELPNSSQKKDNYVGLNPSSGHLREESRDFPSDFVDEARIIALLDDLEGSVDNMWKESANPDEYDHVSGSSYESPSDVDFDDDLLGRGQDELQEVEVQRRPMYRRPQAPIGDQDNLDLSDELELDFDINSPTSRKVTTTAHELATATNRVHRSHSSVAQYVRPSSPANDVEPLRLRGGASTPETKVMKRGRNSSPASSPHKRTRFLEPITENRNHIVGHAISDPPTTLEAATDVAGPVGPCSGSLPIVKSPTRSSNRSLIPLGDPWHSSGPELMKQPRDFTWTTSPPTTAAVISSLRSLQIPRVLPRSAYYSMDEDVPNTTREYGGKEFRLISESLQFLGIFRCGSIFAGSIFQDTSRWISDRRPSLKVWQFEKKPPLKPLLELDSHGTNIPVYGLQPGLSFGPDVY
jgi:DNA polymerase zeta